MAVGKEGDIYVVKDDAGDSRVLKMHRCVFISSFVMVIQKRAL